jgi:putative ABC transport system permease protein
MGMVMFIVVQRKKEIGVRKVNGANASQIMVLLNSDFIKWLALSLVITTPLTWYAINLWLQNFAYKTVLSWWIFILAGLFTFIIAIVAVSFQTYRAAIQNPVESLKYE